MVSVSRGPTTPRRRTPSRAVKANSVASRFGSPAGSLSPPPPLPTSSRSVIPADPVKEWIENEKATDPVFSSKEQVVAVSSLVGGHGIQPYEHVSPNLFPNVARIYGLRRWKHRRIPPNKSRGPSCTLPGHSKVVKCHMSCIPAFLYKLPDKECAQARKRRFPTLIFNWNITKDNDLVTHSCWACFTSGDSDCPIKDTRLSPHSSLSPTLHSSVRSESFDSRQATPSVQSPTIPAGELYDTDRASFAPRKASRTRTASEAELEPVPLRQFLLATSAPGLADSAMAKPSESAVSSSTSLPGKETFAVGSGRRVVSDTYLQPAPMILDSKRRALSEGLPDNWRTVLAHELERPKSLGPDPGQLQASIDQQAIGAPEIVIQPSTFVGNSANLSIPETPSPLPRSSAVPPSTPKRLFTTDAIVSGLLAVRQEFSQAVASVRTAYELAERAEKAASEAIEKTQGACEALKEEADSEQHSIESLRTDRDKNALQVEVLKGRVAENTTELKQKAARIRELEKQLAFLQTKMATEKQQQASFDSLLADAVNNAKTAEEGRAQMSKEVDRLREVIRQEQSRLRESTSRQSTLAWALAGAGKENDHLLEQIKALCSSLEGFTSKEAVEGILAETTSRVSASIEASTTSVAERLASTGTLPAPDSAANSCPVPDTDSQAAQGGLDLPVPQNTTALTSNSSSAPTAPPSASETHLGGSLGG